MIVVVVGAQGDKGPAGERDGRGFTNRLGTLSLSNEVGVPGVGVRGKGDGRDFTLAGLWSTEILIEWRLRNFLSPCLSASRDPD